MEHSSRKPSVALLALGYRMAMATLNTIVLYQGRRL
jgi:hypothetical protein